MMARIYLALACLPGLLLWSLLIALAISTAGCSSLTVNGNCNSVTVEQSTNVTAPLDLSIPAPPIPIPGIPAAAARAPAASSPACQ